MYAERERNLQKLLPHTPTVIDRCCTLDTGLGSELYGCSGLIAFRRELILAPSMIGPLAEAINLLEDSALGGKLDTMLKHLDIHDDHLFGGHRYSASPQLQCSIDSLIESY